MNEEQNQNYGVKNELLAFVWETVKVVVISLAIILPIRYYLVQPFFVKGASMEPNFEDGDYILVDELTYHFREPKRGEVVIFRFPQQPSQFFIKRIIGLPEETVQIKDNQVTIFNKSNPKGFVLRENYLAENQKTLGALTAKLDNNEYYVLGDNRLQSSDSRRWGSVNKTLIIGRAFIRPWPLNRLSKLSPVIY